MSGLHTFPDAAEDQQLLLDVRALLERSQRQAAKNRALEAHREKVEATLGRVQEALGTKMPRHDGFEELDGDHELSAALRAAARDSAALDARVEDAAALPEESRAALGEMHGALRSLRALALLLPLFYAGYAGIAAGACAALGVPFESAAAFRPLRLWAGGPRRPACSTSRATSSVGLDWRGAPTRDRRSARCRLVPRRTRRSPSRRSPSRPRARRSLRRRPPSTSPSSAQPIASVPSRAGTP